MKSDEYRFYITEKAESDLDGIIDYISVELSNPKAASDFIDDFLKHINRICSFPESGMVVSNEYLPEGSVRQLIVGNYLIYYMPDHNRRVCVVLRVVYGGRDLANIIDPQDK